MGGLLITPDSHIDSTAHELHVALREALSQAFPARDGSDTVRIYTSHDIDKLVRLPEVQRFGLGRFVQDYVVAEMVPFAVNEYAMEPLGRALGKESLAANQPNDRRRLDAAGAFTQAQEAVRAQNPSAAERLRRGYFSARGHQRSIAAHIDATPLTPPIPPDSRLQVLLPRAKC